MPYLVPAPHQLGATLRGLRKEAGLTQAQVGAAAGLNQKTVSLLETGPQRCSVETLFRYLGALKASISLESAQAPRPGAARTRW